MALTDKDAEIIWKMIESKIPTNEVTYGVVTKRDVRRKLIWLTEYGDQPIPIVGLRYKVKVYDDNGTNVTMKTYEVTPQVPLVGDKVVVLRQMGSRRLPKCVGVILSPGGYQGV